VNPGSCESDHGRGGAFCELWPVSCAAVCCGYAVASDVVGRTMGPDTGHPPAFKQCVIVQSWIRYPIVLGVG